MDNNVKKPRAHVLIWLACLGGLVAFGCKEIQDLLATNFPAQRGLIQIATVFLLGLGLVHVSIKPMFKELGKKLR